MHLDSLGALTRERPEWSSASDPRVSTAGCGFIQIVAARIVARLTCCNLSLWH
jgi:hypothetical protein